MSEQVKFIVQELNKPPFSKNLNLVNFDGLESIQLLQTLTDVLAVIDPKQKIDVREETPDQTAIRIFTVLRVLKFKPPETDKDALSEFRQGVVSGEKHVLVPVLEWLLRRVPELQKRAFLARFLMALDIPSEYLSDQTLSDLYLQHERLISEFKEVHKELDDMKSSGLSTAEVKKDIAQMEDERDQLVKRIDRLKRKVQQGANSEMMLTLAKNYRLAKECSEDFVKQKQEQTNLLKQMDQRHRRLQQQVKDAKQANVGAKPEAIYTRLEEELKINHYMVDEKLPKEVQLKTQMLTNITMVLNEPAMGQVELNNIIAQVKAVNAELNQLTEKRMLTKDSAEDKTAVFRNQAAIISRKKEASAEKLFTLREQYSKLEAEVGEKRANLTAVNGGVEILKGDEFQRYVNRLRSKKTDYKTKSQELAQLKAECGVLVRTEEILKQRFESVSNNLAAEEADKGVPGAHETQDELAALSAKKAETDTNNATTLEHMSKAVVILNRRLTEKRTSLAPVIKDLRPLRDEMQLLQEEYDTKKVQYDTLMAGLESNRAKQEQEWKAVRDESQVDESRYHYIYAMSEILAIQMDKVKDEMKMYTTGNAPSPASGSNTAVGSTSDSDMKKQRSLRDQYTRRIQEQDSLGRTLRDKQKQLKDGQMERGRQTKLWLDVVRLLDCKLRVVDRHRPPLPPQFLLAATVGGQEGQDNHSSSAVISPRASLLAPRSSIVVPRSTVYPGQGQGHSFDPRMSETSTTKTKASIHNQSHGNSRNEGQGQRQSHVSRTSESSGVSQASAHGPAGQQEQAPSQAQGQSSTGPRPRTVTLRKGPAKPGVPLILAQQGSQKQQQQQQQQPQAVPAGSRKISSNSRSAAAASPPASAVDDDDLF